MSPARTVHSALLIAATELEIRPVLHYVTGLERHEKQFFLAEGTLGGASVLLAETGVGKSNAAITTSSLLDSNPASTVIMTGCAGAFPQARLTTGDVVVADREVFADEGVLTPRGFLDLREIGLPIFAGRDGHAVYNEIPIEDPPVDVSSLADGLDFTVIAGTIATVSTCSGTPEAAERLHARWGAVAEAMEGAAAALAALRANRRFLEIRGISNLAGGRDRDAWEIERAASNAACVVARVVAALGERREREARS